MNLNILLKTKTENHFRENKRHKEILMASDASYFYCFSLVMREMNEGVRERRKYVVEAVARR